MLSKNLEDELGAVNRLFSNWNQDSAFKRTQALAASNFSDAQTFKLALVVFNRRGEHRKGIRRVQDWYFAERHKPATSVEQHCARCCVNVSRQETYFVDKAKDWKQADELCRQCLVWAMRFHLGNDDRAIMEEAQQILESSWGPVLNHRLADVLMESRTHFSML